MCKNKLHVGTYSTIRFTLRFANLFVEVSRVWDGPQTKIRKMKKNRENGAKYVLKNCYIIDSVWVRLQSWESIDLV